MNKLGMIERDEECIIWTNSDHSLEPNEINLFFFMMQI